jgi:hypothetical protein
MAKSRGRKPKKKSAVRRQAAPATSRGVRPGGLPLLPGANAEQVADLLLKVPDEALPLYAVLTLWNGIFAGQAANSCQMTCLSLQAALAEFAIASELRVVQARITGPAGTASVGSMTPAWEGPLWNGHVVLYLPDQARIVDATLHQSPLLPRHGIYALPLVGRVVAVLEPLGGRRQTSQTLPGGLPDLLRPGQSATSMPEWRPGDAVTLQRGQCQVSYDLLGDDYQGSWAGPRIVAATRQVERNGRSLADLTVELLKSELFIDRALAAPYPALRHRLTEGTLHDG